MRLHFVVCIFLSFSISSLASAGGGSKERAHPGVQTAVPIQAEIVLDLISGTVLWSKNATTPIRPASLAKIMTLKLLFDAIDRGKISPNTRITFSEAAAARPNTKLGLAVGSSISASEAALCLAVHSCNDVATAVAEALSGDEDRFAIDMTRSARELGMRHTNFANASGLPDTANTTDVRDLAILGVSLLAGQPSRWHVLSVPSWSFGGREFLNTNELLATYPGMEGGKTGYVREAGFHLLAVASRGERRVLAIVAGGQTARSRDRRMTELFDAAFASIRGQQPR